MSGDDFPGDHSGGMQSHSLQHTPGQVTWTSHDPHMTSRHAYLRTDIVDLKASAKDSESVKIEGVQNFVFFLLTQ